MASAAEEERAGRDPDVSDRLFRVGCVAILAFSLFFRVWGLDDVPAGLFCDEAGNGYNAYSLLKSGRDEEGSFLPVYVWSFGVSYKNPVFIYSAIPVVAVLGLSETTIRLVAGLWGVLGVASFLWLGTVLCGRRGGLWSGLLLAISPWHLHFSRIAFELIALLPLVAGGFAAFLLGVRGRPRWLVVSAFAFALGLYAYAPAKFFIPLFLLAAAVLYAKPLFAAGRWTLAAIATAVVTGIPLLVFDLTHRQRSGQYFSETTIVDWARPVESLANVAANWSTFFTADFLFLYGDPLVRHSVPGVGQIYLATAPLTLAGVVWCLRRGRPQGKLLLWWLFLYPIAPSLMNEVPSASRGFIGVGAFCLLAAAGATAITDKLLARGHSGARGWAHDILMCVVLATMAFEAGRYGYRYVDQYPELAAEAFQYGYREVLELMEPARSEFDTLLLTTTGGNQAQIFPLFYNRVSPEQWLDGYNPGYLIIDPAEFGRYDPARERVLAGLRDSDLSLFDELEVRGEVRDLSGEHRLFTVAEIKQRGVYLRDWLLLGAFANEQGQAQAEDHFPGHRPRLDAHSVDGTPRYWRRILPFFVRVELHHFYRSAIEPSGMEPRWVCAYATTELLAAKPMDTSLELDGPQQWVQGWLNGVPLTSRMEPIGNQAARWVMSLEAGSNQLLLKTCRGHADWSFTARLRAADGGQPVGVRSRARIQLPEQAIDPFVEPAQVVSGFSEIVAFAHRQEHDGDYRGQSVGWVEHLYDSDGAVEWKTAAVPRRAPTELAFTAVLSPVPGTAQLWVDGRFALEFRTARFTTPQTWTRGPYRLQYWPQQNGDYRSGYWLLRVPAEQVRAGQPLRLRVSHVDGERDASFMLKDRADTAVHEELVGAQRAKR